MASSLTTADEQTALSFMGLKSYTEEEANSFFGRDTEIEKLTALIYSNTLTIVFGKSGTGKTSLLNAGVFPRLHKNYCLPFRIRLNFNADSANLVTQIKNVLKSEIDKYGFKISFDPLAENLWEFFHKEPLWKSITPILIFDQFEEIFTLAGKNENLSATELAEFWELLSNLAENSIPISLREQFLKLNNEVGYNYRKQKVKMVFAFREEFLPEFESISKIIPSIKTSRFRLMPMNGLQAYEVITKTWRENIKASEARVIVSYLTDEAHQDNYDLMTIEPSLLSQVCAYIDKEKIECGYKTVSAELLKKYPKETILRSIYEEAINAAGERVGYSATQKEKSIHNPVKIFLEEKLIDSEGYRLRYKLATVDEKVRPGIDELKERYFVRQDEKTVELTHDVLTPIIKTDREQRRKRDARSTIIRRALILAGVLLALFIGVSVYGYFKTIAAAEESKQQTLKQVEDLKQGIVSQQYTLDSLKRLGSIWRAKFNRNGGGPGGKNIDGTPFSDSLGIGLKIKIDQLTFQLDSLNKSYQALSIKFNNLKQSRGLDPNSNPKSETIENTVYQVALDKISNLEFENENLKSKIDVLIKRNAYLEKDNKILNDLLKKYNPKPWPDIVAEKPVDTTNALQLDLYFSKKQNRLDKPAPNTTVYLVPYTSAKNKRIIRRASYYEIRCNEVELSSADDVKRARYYNGKFVFENLQGGKYFIKICSYYGGYETIYKPDGPSTQMVDASPPIR
ncbi:hypothetical protein BH11BAC3_BH11BAC3_05670 [soil metagenome]